MEKIKIVLTGIFALVLMANLFAQQPEEPIVEKKKKIVIHKKIVDEEGNVHEEKIIREGDDAGDLDLDELHEIEIEDGEIRIFKHEGGELKLEQHDVLGDFSMELEEAMEGIEFELEDIDGKRVIKLEVDGEEPFIWEGEGELPEEVKEKLEKYGVDLDRIRHGSTGDHHLELVSPPNKAVLGVVAKTTEAEDGARILEIIAGSAAAQVGLQEGDIITAIDDRKVSSVATLVKALEDYEPGAAVTVSYLRDNAAQLATATLKEADTHRIRMKLDQLDEEVSDGVRKEKQVIIIKKSKDSSSTQSKTNVSPAEGNVHSSQTLELPSFRAFPNPTGGQVTVDFQAEAIPTILVITDVSGKEIYREELNAFDGMYNKEIDLSDAAKGTLLLSIYQNNKVFNQQILFQ